MAVVDAVNKGRATAAGLIAICGNPNCGKTTIFNAITGLNQQVGNYSGVTVEKVTGRFSAFSNSATHYQLVDIPGTYSLSAFSPDEFIAASSLYSGIDGEKLPDAIICVIDATKFERSLYLLLQVLQIGRPVVVAINMIDIARRHGQDIDCAILSDLLGGVPVLPVVGNKGIGIKELKEAAAGVVGSSARILTNIYPPTVEAAAKQLDLSSPNGHRTRAEILRVLFDVDSPAERKYLAALDASAAESLLEARNEIRTEFGSLTAAETIVLTETASKIARKVVRHPEEKQMSVSDRVDRYLLHPILGPVILLVVMLTVFQSIFSWASPFIDWIDTVFGSLSSLVGSGMTEGPLKSLITDGIIGGVGSVLVFVPQIAILFLFISILEDSGYMARAAFLVDKLFRWCGLSGKSFIPLLSSFACAIPGIMATRTIEDRKLRLMTIAVAPLMSCSARLPVYTIMIAAFIPYERVLGPINIQGIVLTALYAIGVVVAIVVSFVLKKTVLRAQKGTFLMEMPGYKIPTLRSVAIRVISRVKAFILRAGTVIMAITIVIWALSYFPRSDFINQKYERLNATVQERFDRLWPYHNSEIMALIVANRHLETLNDNLTNSAADVFNPEELMIMQSKFVGTAQAERQLARNIFERRLVEIDRTRDLIRLTNEEAGENLANSYFGKLGRLIAPAFEPLGWDWKISMAVMASFPAREVVIATMGTIYNLGSEVGEESGSLVGKMQRAKWESGEKKGSPIFTPAVAMSIMIFFALCCQCGATLVTIKQETASLLIPLAVFSYMSILAYLGAWGVYSLFRAVWY